MKLAVFLPNWIGDVAMATPTLRALRRGLGPEAQLVGVMRPYVADVLAGTTWLDRRLFFDPRARDASQRGWGFLRRLRAERLDAVLLLTNSFRSGCWAWASGAPQRIGYARGGRTWLLTDSPRQPKRRGRFVPTPVLDDYLALAGLLNCPTGDRRLELATLPADEAAADDAWARLGLPEGRRTVVLNSGGAFGAAKLWPTEYFAQLARRITSELDLSVLVICGPSERSIAVEMVRQAADKRVVCLAEEPLSIGLSKACVRRSRLLVTTDSGPRHFAAAFGVPVVTLFGPTHIAWSETHYDRAIHLQEQVPCGPCQQRICPLVHHRCMRELSVDRVLAAVLRQLDASLQSRAA